VGPEEVRAVAQAVRQGRLGGLGSSTRAVESRLQELLGVRSAVLMDSCTAAMQTALAVLGVKGGDVLLPSFSFPSTAAAIVAEDATPVFVDIEPLAFGLDPAALQRAISSRTRAIIYVDYGGFPGTLETARHLASTRRVPFIEDAAHALGSSLHGRPLGGWGDIGCVSFHETKSVTCGEGGVFVTENDALAERARAYREYGTNRAAFFDGRVEHYEWTGPGGSYLLAEPLAALLEQQLVRLPQMVARQRAIAQAYREAFAPLIASGAVRVPIVPSAVEANWHVFPLVVRDRATAEALLGALADRGIDARRHFYPLHLSAYAHRSGWAPSPLPVTESIAERLIRLPIYPALASSHQQRIIRAVRQFYRLRPAGNGHR
jgi:dTDP-4-amino-4,6-dideoxygalactose transaminase